MSAHVTRQRDLGTWLIWNDDGEHIRFTDTDLWDVVGQVAKLQASPPRPRLAAVGDVPVSGRPPSEGDGEHA